MKPYWHNSSDVLAQCVHAHAAQHRFEELLEGAAGAAAAAAAAWWPWRMDGDTFYCTAGRVVAKDDNVTVLLDVVELSDEFLHEGVRVSIIEHLH
jgi:hypothetical protein